jgi:hypothetical protein
MRYKMSLSVFKHTSVSDPQGSTATVQGSPNSQGRCRRTARAACSHSASQSQLFFELMLVWQQLASRFSVAREGQYQAQLLLTALKLAIAAQRVSPRSPDGRYALVPAIISYPGFQGCERFQQIAVPKLSCQHEAWKLLRQLSC